MLISSSVTKVIGFPHLVTIITGTETILATVLLTNKKLAIGVGGGGEDRLKCLWNNIVHAIRTKITNNEA